MARFGSAVVLLVLTVAGCADHAASLKPGHAAAAGASTSTAPKSRQSPATVGAYRSPACSVDRLSASTTLGAVGAGRDDYRITITDHGPPCSLHGRPSTLVGVYASGRRSTLHPSPLSTDDNDAMTTEQPAIMSRRRNVDVVLVTGIACPAGQHHPAAAEKFTSLRLGVGRSRLTVKDKPGPEPYDKGIWLPCGVAMSGFYASFPPTR
jgi:hypothetical protein